MRAVAQAQQIYYTRETGAGLWQALRGLRDNPIAHYGMLQERRLVARTPGRWRWLAGALLVLACAACSPVVGHQLFQQFINIGIYSFRSADLLASTVYYSLITLALASAAWLAQGVFTTVRDAVLMLSSHRAHTLSCVDELVAISSLSNTEVLAGVLKLLARPLLPRILLGASLPGLWLNGLLVFGQHAIFQHAVYTGVSGYTKHYLQQDKLLPSSAYSLKSIMALEGASALCFVSMSLLGILALISLLLFVITCGRKTGNALIASSAAFLQAASQLAQSIILGNITVLYVVAIDLFWRFNLAMEIAGIIITVGLFTGIASLLILIRFLRNSYLLRYSALLVPALLVAIASGWVAAAIFRSTSWLSWLGLPLGLAAPGFAVLAYATGLVDQFASPVLPTLSLLDYTNCCIIYTFNSGWVLKLGCQAILLPALFTMARDAVRLHRQPGLL
jgi:hypothetical protein